MSHLLVQVLSILVEPILVIAQHKLVLHEIILSLDLLFHLSLSFYVYGLNCNQFLFQLSHRAQSAIQGLFDLLQFLLLLILIQL